MCLQFVAPLYSLNSVSILKSNMSISRKLLPTPSWILQDMPLLCKLFGVMISFMFLDRTPSDKGDEAITIPVDLFDDRSTSDAHIALYVRNDGRPFLPGFVPLWAIDVEVDGCSGERCTFP